ncbi:MAG: hypothetical protein V1712_02835 [Patescibacteria group bacterium]
MGRNNVKICLIIITTGLLAGGLAFAQDLPPKIPVLYYGTASLNGVAATSSPIISARLKSSSNGQEIASATAGQNGGYFIEMPCADHVGQTMIFRIGNLIVREANCVDVATVPSVKLDLNFDSANQTIDSAVSNINIPSSVSDTTEVKINFIATSTTDGHTTATTSAAGLTLTRDSTVPANKFTVTFPPNTVITGDSSWDGTLIAPSLSNISLNIPADPDMISRADQIINLGFTGQILTFDKPVSILFTGQTGKRIGFSHTGSDFTEITVLCPENSANSLLATTTQECKFNGLVDLTVWTNHFTYYAVYTQVYVPPPPRGGGGFLLKTATTTVATTTSANLIATSTPTVKPETKLIVVPQILPQVLGVKYYANGTLIRGKDKKIYLIQNNKLVVIRNLAQLKKYAGQKIYDETDEVIRQYLPFPDGSLVRGSMKKIYVIKNGKRQPIFTLTELRKKYRGQKIYDVSDQILGLY